MRKEKKEYSYLEMEEALETLISNISKTEDKETVSIYCAVGRVAAKGYRVRFPNPPFDRSPLDGYALSSEVLTPDISRDNPVSLRVAMKICAGDSVRSQLERGCAARIMTGGMIPKGADCVIRQEDSDYGEDTVLLYRSAKANENICKKGEDSKVLDDIVRVGETLTFTEISLLASQGYGEILVFKPLTVGIVSTGSELLEASKEECLMSDGDGKIFDSNGPMICARLSELGIKSHVIVAGDDESIIKEAILKSVETYHAVITTGGVSVGEKDYLPQVIQDLDAAVLFHGISMKPGSPMMAARKGNKIIFSLSGNPFAAFVNLELLVIPALLKAMGVKNYRAKTVYSFLKQDFRKESKGRRFIRGSIDNSGVDINRNHLSGGMLGNKECNCLIDIKAGSKMLSKGNLVKVILFQGMGIKAFDLSKRIPVYAVSGYHKTGKTTLLESTVKSLKEQGYCVAVIKHDGHEFEPDVPGTDSSRLKKAGADAVAVCSAVLEELVQDIESMEAEQIVWMVSMQIHKKPDIILLEGFKSSSYEKTMLIEENATAEELKEKGRQLALYLGREVIRRT